MLELRVGQVWKTRGGVPVVITKDRAQDAIVPRWRWALNNGDMCDVDGKVGIDNECEGDLMTLLSDSQPVGDSIPSAEQVKGMDSTMGVLR